MTLCNPHALRDKLHSLYRDLRHHYLLKQSKINFQGRVKLTWASQHSLANASLSCVAVTLHEPRIVTRDRQEFEENLEMKLPSTSLFHRQGNPKDLGFTAGPSAMAGRGDGPARCLSPNFAASVRANRANKGLHAGGPAPCEAFGNSTNRKAQCSPPRNLSSETEERVMTNLK